MTAFKLNWNIGQQHVNQSIKDFLKEQQISRTALTDIKFNGGSILVNNTPVTVRYQLKLGDMVEVTFPKETPSLDLIPAQIKLDIIYEDDYLLVVNKQPYLSTIPSREHPRYSLANGLLSYFEKIGLEATIHIVNRLDRDTSGLLAVAKSRFVHHLLSQQQKSGKITRRYEAIVHGELQHDKGVIDAPIGRRDTSIIEREVRDDGQYAVTHYAVLGKYKNLSHVALKLETGRTHQIRVHLSHLGHPIVGDDLYGGSREKIQRQALHAYELSFFHPITDNYISFRAPLPKDITNLMATN